MKQHWKKLVIGLVAVAVVVLAASFIYAKFWNQADPELNSDDVKELLEATTTVGNSETDPTGTPSSSGPTDSTTPPVAGEGVDGTWAISTGSVVGYRVNESINGFDTTANGRTQAVTGSIAIAGTTVSTGEFTVDMTTFESLESRRDGQFDGRIMDVNSFPTATFVLTAPIDFGTIPTDDTTFTVSATGDLTLRGTTKSVTFELEASFLNGRVGVLGQIPIVFADFGIPNPSVATVTTEDHGLLEFVLVLDRA